MNSHRRTERGAAARGSGGERWQFYLEDDLHRLAESVEARAARP
jgi:hypothetical protein